MNIPFNRNSNFNRSFSVAYCVLRQGGGWREGLNRLLKKTFQFQKRNFGAQKKNFLRKFWEGDGGPFKTPSPVRHWSNILFSGCFGPSRNEKKYPDVRFTVLLVSSCFLFGEHWYREAISNFPFPQTLAKNPPSSPLGAFTSLLSSLELGFCDELAL